MTEFELTVAEFPGTRREVAEHFGITIDQVKDIWARDKIRAKIKAATLGRIIRRSL